LTRHGEVERKSICSHGCYWRHGIRHGVKG
jgi:hypothetical protein